VPIVIINGECKFMDADSTGGKISSISGDTEVNSSQHKNEKIASGDADTLQLIVEKHSPHREGTSNNNNVNSSKSILTSELRSNDNRILSLLSRESGSNYSFRGLMRSLNLHQQSLTRALNRLEYLGLIEKSSSGYKLSKNTETTLPKHIISGIPVGMGKQYSQLMQTYIPINIKTSDIVKHLIGKWFDKLRWAGLVGGEAGYTLQWISTDNEENARTTVLSNEIGNSCFQVNLRLMSDYIIIETNAVSDKEKVQAMTASYKILQLITKLVQEILASKPHLCTAWIQYHMENN
jgi:DNA-binding transcriptional ArsR family regulator